MKPDFLVRELFVDLGLSKLIAAQKAEQKIAVEIKRFANPSSIAYLEQTLGQYLLYRAVLEEVEPDFLLYLAVRKITYQAIFSEPIGELVIHKYRINLLVFESKKKEVWQWKP